MNLEKMAKNLYFGHKIVLYFREYKKFFLEHLHTFVLAPFRPLNHQNSEGKTQDMLKKFSKKQQLPTGLKSALYCTVKSPKMTAPSSNPSIT